MTRPEPVTGVGVLVPARDEADGIAACVASVLTALAACPGLEARALCVLADRCSDGTAALARRAIARHPASGPVRTAVLGSSRPVPVGASRNRAAAAVLALLATPPDRTWVLSTDADGHVLPGWVRSHLAAAADGADAVAGGVVLDLPGRPAPPDEPAWPEGPVYAANLGVRGSAFRRVGGFPEVACGEDHGIVDRLRAAGLRVEPGAPATVCTSARTRGRAEGGLADLLHGRRVGAPGAGSRPA